MAPVKAKLDYVYIAGITFIVVQKRHHTRLFYADKKEQSGKSGNIPAGTSTVDADITHPTEFDFYLCSRILASRHSAVLATITFLLNLPALSYLCALYSLRLHSGAGLLRFPCQIYHLVEKEHDRTGSHQSGSSEDRTPGAMASAITVHADTKKVMYFV
ncbi:putative Argonaute protein [Daphnia pulex]|uniref:Putative Argonaute protein n=1 Tax=Daphnia pulex TaxID=6669 RepID=E9HGI9_DAPPU|nr:putative Argonaute protein [Daphnia pulex]|eukprot:EFX69090.1 putative Argonaute protein [Daphnia pulex]